MWLNSIFPFYCPSPHVEKKLVKYENDLEFQNTLVNLINIMLYSFNINGLPETCNERYFKLNLILHGQALLAKDNDYGYLTLMSMPAGSEWNMYGECSSVYGYGWNGFNKEYTNYMYGSDNSNANAIICRDNDLLYPMLNYLIMGAKRLSSIMRTLDVSSRKLKTPYFITCDDTQRSSVKQILDDVDFNKDAIICNKSTMPNMFQVLNTNVNPESITRLWEHYNNTNAQLRSIMGINNATNQDKKERLLVDEVNADNMIRDINLNVRLAQYEKFCKTANAHFGLNLSVKNNIKECENNGTNQNKLLPDDSRISNRDERNENA